MILYKTVKNSHKILIIYPGHPHLGHEEDEICMVLQETYVMQDMVEGGLRNVQVFHCLADRLFRRMKKYSCHYILVFR